MKYLNQIHDTVFFTIHIKYLHFIIRMDTMEESWAELDGVPAIWVGLDYSFESINAVEPRRTVSYLIGSGVNENESDVEYESDVEFLTRIRREMDEQLREFIEEERRAASIQDDKKYVDVFPNGWKNGAGPNPYANKICWTKEEEKKVINLRMNFR